MIVVELRIGRIFISGTVRGNIQAKKRVQIAAGGKVFADLDTTSLVIEDGGILEGRCAMTRAEPATAAPPKLVPQKVPAPAKG